MAKIKGDKDTLPVLVIKPEKEPIITGNFDVMEAYLIRNRDKYKAMDFSSAPIAEIKTIKKEMQVLRTSTQRIEKDTNDKFFNNPKKLVKGNFARLYTLIAEVEGPLDDLIAQEDQKRIDGVTFAIEGYIQEFTTEEPLAQRYLDRLEYKKKYYNVTQDEEATRNDVLEQVVALQKMQKADLANVRIITTRCKEDERLSLDLYLNLLERGDDVASILEMIEAEVVRLNDISEPTKEAPVEFALEAQDEIDTKTATVKLTYAEDLSGKINELFNALTKEGVVVEIITRS